MLLPRKQEDPRDGSDSGHWRLASPTAGDPNFVEPVGTSFEKVYWEPSQHGCHWGKANYKRLGVTLQVKNPLSTEKASSEWHFL